MRFVTRIAPRFLCLIVARLGLVMMEIQPSPAICGSRNDDDKCTSTTELSCQSCKTGMYGTDGMISASLSMEPPIISVKTQILPVINSKPQYAEFVEKGYGDSVTKESMKSHDMIQGTEIKSLQFNRESSMHQSPLQINGESSMHEPKENGLIFGHSHNTINSKDVTPSTTIYGTASNEMVSISTMDYNSVSSSSHSEFDLYISRTQTAIFSTTQTVPHQLEKESFSSNQILKSTPHITNIKFGSRYIITSTIVGSNYETMATSSVRNLPDESLHEHNIQTKAGENIKPINKTTQTNLVSIITHNSVSIWQASNLTETTMSTTKISNVTEPDIRTNLEETIIATENESTQNDTESIRTHNIVSNLCSFNCVLIVIVGLSCFSFSISVLCLFFFVKYRQLVTRTRILHSITKPLNLYSNIEIDRKFDCDCVSPTENSFKLQGGFSTFKTLINVHCEDKNIKKVSNENLSIGNGQDVNC